MAALELTFGPPAPRPADMLEGVEVTHISKQEMLAARRVLIAKMKNFLEFRQVELRDQKEITTVRALPGMWQHLFEFQANLEILTRRNVASYNGEGLAAYSLKVLIGLMRPERSSPPQMEGCCSICGSNALLQKDHRVPVSCGGTGDLENFNYLCSACHLDKTRQEQHTQAHSRGNLLNPILSYFNRT